MQRTDECPASLTASKYAVTSGFALPTSTAVADKSMRRSKAPICCKICSKVFATRSSARRHVQIHKGHRPYKCTACQKRFTQKCNLTVHVRRHTGKFPYSCPPCGKGFDRLKAFELHRARHHGPKVFRCEVCKQTFLELKDLVAHRPVHAATHPHCCQQCKKRFSDRRNLAVHLRIHANLLPYACSQCDRKFRQKRCLQRHSVTHTGERPYACDACGKRFASSESVKRHAATHDPSKRRHACEFCGIACSDRQSLDDHLTMHSGTYPYRCRMCAGGFANSRQLKSHLAAHTRTTAYACDICERRYRHRGSVAAHRMTHFGEVRFVCDVCGKAFSHKSNFQRHQRTHASDRPFACDVCGARFTARHSLKYHWLQHQGQVPTLSCEWCGSEFRSRSALTYHRLKHLASFASPKGKEQPSMAATSNGAPPSASKPVESQAPVQRTPVDSAQISPEVRLLVAVQAVDLGITGDTMKCSYPRVIVPLRVPEVSNVSKCPLILPKSFPSADNPSSRSGDRNDSRVDIGVVVQQKCPSGSDVVSESSAPKTSNPMAVRIEARSRKSSRETRVVVMPSSQVNEKISPTPGSVSSISNVCRTCKKKFRSERTLSKHVLVHQKDRPFTCTHCQETFTAKSSLVRHLRRHEGSDQYTCRLCKSTFTQPGNLKVHHRRKHPQVPFEGASGPLVKSSVAVDGITQSVAVRCTDREQTSGVLEDACHGVDLLVRSSNGQAPETSGRAVTPSEGYPSAARAGENALQSPGCTAYPVESLRQRGPGFSQTRIGDLATTSAASPQPSSHDLVAASRDDGSGTSVGVEITEEPVTYSCHRCCRRFRLRSCLKAHLRQVRCSKKVDIEDRKPSRRSISDVGQSPRCGGASNQGPRSDVQSSGRQGSAPEGMVFYTCSYCGDKFTDPIHFEDHIFGHSSKFLHSCRICHATFSSRDVLERHLTRHDRRRPFRCRLCGSRFMKRCLIRAHALTHAVESRCRSVGFQSLQSVPVRATSELETAEKAAAGISGP